MNLIKNNFSIQDLNLTIGTEKILTQLNLELIPSEIHVITGLSGSGKSQLLRTLAQLNHDLSPFRTQIKSNIVFQENNLIPWLTLKQNLEITKQFTKKEIDDLFLEVNLEKYKDYKPHQVSGGMQQRVSLIRALSKECELLLLDEPFSKLDLAHKQMNYDLLSKIWTKYSPTIILVTHDIDEAIYFADRISVMSKANKKIIYTENISISRPRNYIEMKLIHEYRQVYERISQKITSDYTNAKN
jgi:ABC-type nitrate/sulfonate/bicarbonate transport system ATPase subunit